MLRSTILLIALASPTLVLGQGSHRALPPPDAPGGEFGQNIDLLRQLQRAVENSNMPTRGQVDPSQFDPKLLEAVEHLAQQFNMQDQLPPEWSDWVEQARQHQQATGLPGGSNDTPGGKPNFRFGPNGIFRADDPNAPNTLPEPPPFRPNDQPKQRPSQAPEDPGDRRPGDGLIDDNPFGGNVPKPGQLPGETPELPDGIDPSNFRRDSKRNADLNQLRDSGMNLRDQLTRALEQARREAILHGDDAASQASSGGLAGMLEDALAKSSTEIAEQLKSARLRNNTQRRSNRRSPSGRNEPRRNESQPSNLNQFNKRLESFSQNANQLTSRITKPNVESSASPNLPDADLTLPSGGPWQASLVLLLIVAGVAGLAYAFYRFSRRTPSLSEQVAALKIPRELTTRADIVRAFHALSQLTLGADNRWWTHRRASRALVAASPQARPALEALTHVYEEARYLPDDEPLSHDHLIRARDAMASLFSAGHYPRERGA